MKISATIITFNEERNIARAIESLRCCDEIVVIDSGSVDRTVEIAEKLGARVVDAVMHGYARHKNLASAHAAPDWIIAIDAAQIATKTATSANEQLKKNGPEFDGYTMPRLAQYLGRWILHSGWYPDRKVRLFDRRKARWVGDFVHESVELEGRVGHLKSNLLHFTCDSLSEHLKTMDRYTTLAAEQLVSRGRKVTFSQMLVDPPWTFFRTFVLQRGFLDGLEIAYMAALYQFLKFAKARYMSGN